MTKLEYLTAHYQEVKKLRDRTANEIAQIIGDDSWMRRRNIPGSAIMHVSRWLGYSKMLTVLDRDIRHARSNPDQTMVVQ